MKNYMSRDRLLAYPIAFILVVIMFGCAHDLISGRPTMNEFWIHDEIIIGNFIKAQQDVLFKAAKIGVDSSKNQRELKRLKRIVKKIASISHFPYFPYEVHIADANIVNASCAPGGKVLVYEGLWDKKSGLVQKGNETELAAVIAHEIAHATGRHVTESLSSRRRWTAFLGGLAYGLSNQGLGWLSGITNLVGNAIIFKYSRTDELEADRIGLMYMAMAGYDPRASIELWQKAAKKSGNDKTSLYSAHPSSEIRVKRLKKVLPEAMAIYEAAKKKEWGNIISDDENFTEGFYDVSMKTCGRLGTKYNVQPLSKREEYSFRSNLSYQNLRCQVHYDGVISCVDKKENPAFICMGKFSQKSNKKKASFNCESIREAPKPCAFTITKSEA